jgi:hypothetical protein
MREKYKKQNNSVENETLSKLNLFTAKIKDKK